MPSKSLLHSAAVHHAGGDYPWPKASDRRDYMINREGIDYPDDVFHTTRRPMSGRSWCGALPASTARVG